MCNLETKNRILLRPWDHSIRWLPFWSAGLYLVCARVNFFKIKLLNGWLTGNLRIGNSLASKNIARNTFKTWSRAWSASRSSGIRFQQSFADFLALGTLFMSLSLSILMYKGRCDIFYLKSFWFSFFFLRLGSENTSNTVPCRIGSQ